MSTIVDGQAGITFSDSSNQPTAGYTGFRNRIYNGDMRIDQRNNGNALIINNSVAAGYSADRCKVETYVPPVGASISVQQSTSIVPPGTGQRYSLGVTVTGADTSTAAGEYYQLTWYVEGYPVSDFNWGTSTGTSATLSFWVYASQTGTYSAEVGNTSGSYSFSGAFTVSASNTWQYITIVIPAPPVSSGQWQTTNGIGISIRIGWVYGTTYGGAASNVWNTTTSFLGGFITPNNNMVRTVGAVLYISGLQLEKGSTATPFEFRPFGTELSLCQRYLYKLYNDNSSNSFFMQGAFNSSSAGLVGTNFPQKMRAVPILYLEGAASNFALYAPNGGAYSACSGITLNAVTSTTYGLLSISIASGGTAGQVAWLAANSQTSYGIGFSAELS